MSKKIIVVGGGVAGLAAAEAARKNDELAEITLICGESVPPYNRTQLSHIFHENKTLDKLLLKPLHWFSDNKIQLKMGELVKEILPEKKQLVTLTGSIYTYDVLILATGAINYLPPIVKDHGPRVATLRNIEDATEIRLACLGANRVIVVGGGLLGLEAAFSLKQYGNKVSVVELAPTLLPKQTNEKTSLQIQNAVIQSGIDLFLGESVTAIDESDSSITVTLASGKKLTSDLVLFSIGIRANTLLAKNIGLATNKGIIVNDFMQTSDPNIFACGDCAEASGVIYGLWAIAQKQGTVAGTNAVGGQNKFVPWIPRTVFNSFGINLFSIGEIISMPKDNEQIVILEENSESSFGQLYLRNGKAVGALLFNTTKLVGKVTKLVENNSPFTSEL